MNLCVIGAGAWGTAMATHLSRFDHIVTLVPRKMEQAMEIATSHENRSYLPGYSLNQNVQVGCELRPVLMEAEVAFLACPSKYLRKVCENIRTELDAAWQLKLFVALCKGLEEGTNLTPCQILSEVLPDYNCGALSGPSFAQDVAAGKPTAIVFAAGKMDETALSIPHVLSNHCLRIYTSDDLAGVEMGGCLKNVYAIAAGICDGLKLGDSAKAALITRSLAEMVRLGTHLGGKMETFYGLSGFGDLIATCNGPCSRNRSFGEKIAEGIPPDDLSRMMTVEGYRTTACFFQLCRDLKLEAPILKEIYAVLYEKKAPKEALRSLMTRNLKGE